MDFSGNNGLEIRACVVIVTMAQGIERGKKGGKKENKGEDEIIRHDF